MQQHHPGDGNDSVWPTTASVPKASERRLHRVFVTRNTEYHVRKDICVAVRDRKSGDWLRGHLAVKQRVEGSLKFDNRGAIEATDTLPNVGQSLFFHAQGRDLVTSPVLAVERPPQDMVTRYPF